MKKLPLLLLLAAPIFSYADAPAYQIEMIIFSQFSANSLDSENWPELQPNLNIGSAYGFTTVPAAQFKMGRVARELAANPHYKILTHVAWLATPAQLSRTPAMHIYGGHAYDNQGNTLANFNSTPSVPFNQYPLWQINGLVSTHLDHYFNFDFNIYFTEPMSELNRISQNGYFKNYSGNTFTFHMTQSRRTRSGELNYMDSPMYGVLVQVFPVMG